MVSVVYAGQYEREFLFQTVEKHFALLSLDRLFSPEMKVVIKPNLLMKRRPEEATTTHPLLVEAIAAALKKRGVTHITIADSPGGLYSPSLLQGIYKASGMEKAAAGQKVSLNTDVSHRDVACSAGTVCKKFPIITPVAEADLVISVAKLKTHGMVGLSGGVKNLFGCIPGLTKPEYHWRFPKEEDFCHMLLDLCETVKPAVTFVDAVISMEGDGPSSGTKKETGMVLCSQSPYEMDEVLCRVAGMDPKTIGTVRLARERGLFCGEPSLCGDPLKTFSFALPKSRRDLSFSSYIPKPLRGVSNLLIQKCLTSRPSVMKNKCIGCGKCAESCPAHTIQIRDKKAVIDPKGCIKCYCCHELCPIHAIEIRRSRLFDL